MTGAGADVGALGMGALGKSFMVYTGLRLLLFVVVCLLLTVLDVRGLVAIAIALLVSSIASLFLLKRQRDEFAAALLERNERRAQEKARLRSMLDEG